MDTDDPIERPPENKALLSDRELLLRIEENTDSINAQAYEANRDRSLAEIEADFHRTFQELLDLVGSLSQEDLDDPQRFPWTRRVPVKRYLNMDGYGHYAVHTRQIRAWLAGQASAE